jgi:hypothetical protein
MEEVWPPELAALLDRAPPAELAALGLAARYGA